MSRAPRPAGACPVAHDGSSSGKIPFLVESNKLATRTVVALENNQRLSLSEISLQEVDNNYGYRVSVDDNVHTIGNCAIQLQCAFISSSRIYQTCVQRHSALLALLTAYCR
jgi:hypothetical protein